VDIGEFIVQYYVNSAASAGKEIIMLKHFSATVYVAATINGEPKVLLHLHKKHHNWYGLGGHVENNEDPVQAAIREAKEEAGIDVTIISPRKKLRKFKYANELIPPALLFDQQIDAHGDAPEHRHFDCIYFGTTPEPAKVAMKEKFRWCSQKDLKAMDLQEDTRYIVNEAFRAYKSSGF
jgi:8-oxo-dGTP pyrophosphatase MutT (NUDIX family)